MKKEIINLKVYVSLITVLYLAYFIYIAFTKGELTFEQGLVIPAILYNLFVNIMIIAKEEITIKQIPILAGISLVFGALSFNLVALIGAVVLFIGYYRYCVMQKLEKNIVVEPIIIDKSSGNEEKSEELPDMVVDGYITNVIFDPNYQGERPYSIEIEYYLGEHVYSFQVGGFDRDITTELDVKNLRHIPVFLQHGSPDLAQIDEEALRRSIDL